MRPNSMRSKPLYALSITALLFAGCGDDGSGTSGQSGGAGTGAAAAGGAGTGSGGIGGTGTGAAAAGGTGTGAVGTGGAGAGGGAVGGGGAAVGGGGGGTGGTTSMAPDAPTNLTATYDVPTPEVDLTWAAPSPAPQSGYLLVRSSSSVSAAGGPVDGTTYAVDDTLLSGATIIYVGGAEAASDPSFVVDATNYYGVWSVGQNNLYSLMPATAQVFTAAPMLGTLSITDPTGVGTVSVNAQPVGSVLSGTSSYDGGSQTLTVSLGIENQLPRLLFNLKATIDGVNQGIATSDGTFQSLPTAYYGPEALDIGATKSRDITITGIDGSVDPIQVDLHLSNHRSVTANVNGLKTDSFTRAATRFIDTSGGTFTAGEAFGGTIEHTLGYQAGNGHLRPGSISPDGRTIYTAVRSAPNLVTIDTTTLAYTNGMDLSNGATGVGSIGSVAISPDGAFLYVPVSTGSHQFSKDPGSSLGATLDAGAYDVDLVKIETAGLTEVGRLSLVSAAGTWTKTGVMAITPDGATGLVPVQNTGSIAVVDLATLTLSNTIDVSATNVDPRAIAIDATATTAVVKYKSNPTAMTLIDLATGTTTAIVLPNGAHGTAIAFGPDGMLYVGDQDGFVVSPSLHRYDLVNMTWDSVLVGGAASASAFYWLSDGTLLFIDGGLDVLLPLDTAMLGNSTLDGKASIPLGGDTHFQHFILETPF